MNKNNREESKIILGCKNNEDLNQKLLYKKYYGYVMAISLSYNPNREIAQEIVDDTFMKVFNTINKFDLNKSFKAWLRKITVNTAIDYLRKDKKFKYHLDIYECTHEMPSVEAIDLLTINDIHNLISKLPDILRVVFNLYEIEGYSHKEISERINIAESSSRTYLVRAKERLRELIINY